ncbi:MAG: MBL fold metallo-hydrolase [Spirochaetaceae bacterium]|jgi:glyoxylase-like metal-dependent hydrolase (beta-lactamase superfamily II)|nr:MBL fold metallo-hydrolase [Spirochaetaceae bacterium]
MINKSRILTGPAPRAAPVAEMPLSRYYSPMSDFALRPLVVGGVSTNCWVVPLDDSGKTRAGEAETGQAGTGQAGTGQAGIGQAAVIDPGDRADRIIARLRELNCAPAFILLSHGHFDHLAALVDLLAAFGPEGGQTAPLVAIHEDDGSYLGEGAYEVHAASFRAAAGDASFVDNLWKPLPAASRLLKDGDRVGPFTVLHLPGHTPGSAAFYWEERNLLFTGDTLFAGGYGRTDLPGGSAERLAASLSRLLSMDGGAGVFPGHGETTTIGRERRYYSG